MSYDCESSGCGRNAAVETVGQPDMQQPATLTDAIDMVRRSRLVAEDRLQTFLLGERPDTSTLPDHLFKRMTTEGLLTPFQAAQIGSGRWMGFDVGNYRILDRLGTGGMGQVFL